MGRRREITGVIAIRVSVAHPTTRALLAGTRREKGFGESVL
jgi:hypothetical protein